MIQGFLTQDHLYACFTANKTKNSRALVRQQTKPTERSPLVGEVSVIMLVLR
jgi:hypothetical protein